MALVAQLKDTPVAALRLLVSCTWTRTSPARARSRSGHSFWGEASSRQEYYDICGKKDEDSPPSCASSSSA
jgi:hypothetical protein